MQVVFQLSQPLGIAGLLKLLVIKRSSYIHQPLLVTCALHRNLVQQVEFSIINRRISEQASLFI